jgi:glucosylceramidase
MKVKHWSRRELFHRCVKTAALLAMSKSWAQNPSPVSVEGQRLTFLTTTENAPWQAGTILKAGSGGTALDLIIEPDDQPGPAAHTIRGFGACFNELGWTALNALSGKDRTSVLRELFHPTEGARFTFCRMPIGANDFSAGPYSYDDTENDFELKRFSIDHDLEALIPFIHAAQSFQPKLRLWASPWTPPSWMKRNGFYAAGRSHADQKDNGIRPDQLGHEGQDLFRVEPQYLETYARYFGKFIDAYAKVGIRIGMVMPQNEFNSVQPFPSCPWTATGLASFLRYLGPEMAKRHVDIFFGTLERGNIKLLETSMEDPVAGPFLKGVGIQWAGKNALSAIKHAYPNLPVIGSEQECGDGQNDWAYTSYCWQLMKTYFRNGASAYMYWNIALAQGAPSTWGWKQNSLVSVDTANGTFRYTHDYYLFKHLTHFVDVGAHRIETSGTGDDALAFRNPDGTVILLLRNELAHPQWITVHAGQRNIALELPSDSIATLSLDRPPAVAA